MAADAKSLAVRVRWLKEAVCPHCLEANLTGREMLIELDPKGEAYCNNCSWTWRPQL